MTEDRLPVDRLAAATAGRDLPEVLEQVMARARTVGWIPRSVALRVARRIDVPLEILYPPVASPREAGRACVVPGCGRQHCARGYCHGHYVRWWTTGDPGPASLERRRRSYGGCRTCDMPHYARGLCRVHYERSRKHDDPGPEQLLRQPDRGCSIDGCDRTHNSHGYCRPHADRLRKYGDPLSGPPIRVRGRSTCRLERCDRPVEGRGLCRLHYSRQRDGRPLEPSRRRPFRRCDVQGCQRKHRARGYCSIHYQRWRAHGDPGEPERRTPGRRVHQGCRVSGCSQPHRARGLCEQHVKHLYRAHGDPEVVAAAAPSTWEQTG